MAFHSTLRDVFPVTVFLMVTLLGCSYEEIETYGNAATVTWPECRVIGVLGFTEVMTHLVNWYVGNCTAGTNRCVLNVRGFKSLGGSQVRQSHVIVDQGWLTTRGGGGGGGIADITKGG